METFTCGTCQWCVTVSAGHDNLGQKQFQCHLNPPQVIGIPLQMANPSIRAGGNTVAMQVQAVYPPVSYDTVGCAHHPQSLAQYSQERIQCDDDDTVTLPLDSDG